jgi:hypothetical protein
MLPLIFLLPSSFQLLASPFLLASGFWLLALAFLPDPAFWNIPSLSMIIWHETVAVNIDKIHANLSNVS